MILTELERWNRRQAAGFLKDGADHCRETGLHVGAYWPGASNDCAVVTHPYVDGEPCCAVGHVYVGAGMTTPGGNNVVDLAVQALADVVGAKHVSYVADWSDKHGRTAVEVEAALRQAAENLELEAAA